MVIVNVIRMSVSWAVRPWSHGRKPEVSASPSEAIFNGKSVWQLFGK